MAFVPGVGNTPAMTLTNNSLGIGVTSPTQTLDVSGTALFETPSNSVTAFQIQNASTTDLFNADTTTNTITLNTPAGGGVLINNGATLDTALSLGDFATGGSIGTAATTVDIHTSFDIAQATSGQTLIHL